MEKYKKYPQNDDFIKWQRTDDNIDKNPYHDRYVCLTESLDMSIESDRYVLGRALYHLSQRRGFLSNRKESTKEGDGPVKQKIQTLNTSMEASGCEFIGEYFYRLYENGDKI